MHISSHIFCLHLYIVGHIWERNNAYFQLDSFGCHCDNTGESRAGWRDGV